MVELKDIRIFKVYQERVLENRSSFAIGFDIFLGKFPIDHWIFSAGLILLNFLIYLLYSSKPIGGLKVPVVWTCRDTMHQMRYLSPFEPRLANSGNSDGRRRRGRGGRRLQEQAGKQGVVCLLVFSSVCIHLIVNWWFLSFLFDLTWLDLSWPDWLDLTWLDLTSLDQKQLRMPK